MTQDTLEHVALSAIDRTDRLYEISPPWLPVQALADSIRSFGILCPLHLEACGDRLRVVIGHRRRRASERLNLASVPAIVHRDRPGLDLFRLALEDNLRGRSLQLMEKARALLKLKVDFKVGEKRLVKEFLPLLGIAGDHRRLKHYLSLASLAEALQRAVGDSLEADVALKMARWSGSEQQLFVELTRSLRPGRNKQQRLFRLLDDLRGGGSDAAAVWQASGAAAESARAGIPAPQRLDRALECLHRRRFPALSSHQERARSLVGALALPARVRLRVPPYLEIKRLDVSFQFSSASELEETSQRLARCARSSQLSELLKLL